MLFMISIFVWLSNFGIFLYCLVLSATVQMLKLHLKLLQILFQFQFSLLETEKTKKRVTSGSYQQQFLVNYLDTVHFQEYCCGRDITLQMGQRLEKENINKYQLSQELKYMNMKQLKPKYFTFAMGLFSSVMVYVGNLKDHLVLQMGQILEPFG